MNCPSCKTANPIYLSVCKRCKSILRNRVPNIDLGDTVLSLLHEPRYAFLNVLQSEKKNYSTVFFIFSAFKILALNYILLAFFYKTSFNFSSGFILNLSLLFLLFIIFALLILLLLKRNNTELRFRDLYALYAFSALPSIIFVVLFLPLEVIVFGEFLFTFDPSPFLINPFFAWFFLVIEIIVLLWQIVLFGVGINILLTSRIKSSIIALIFSALLHSSTFFLFAYLIEVNRRIISGT